ncbi:MAG: hypothetical protein GY835_10320 [bacterium]|nr:hypothetical protein [bacterium]
MSLTTLREVLLTQDLLPEAWLYLPESEPWSLESPALVARSVEVPPEDELELKAGYPAAALQHNLVSALQSATIEDIVSNLQAQVAAPSAEQLLQAFLYYYDNDAFLVVR